MAPAITNRLPGKMSRCVSLLWKSVTGHPTSVDVLAMHEIQNLRVTPVRRPNGPKPGRTHSQGYGENSMLRKCFQTSPSHSFQRRSSITGPSCIDQRAASTMSLLFTS